MKRNGRCVCGLKLTHHFDKRNVFVPCSVARDKHPQARIVRADFAAMMLRAGVRHGEA